MKEMAGGGCSGDIDVDLSLNDKLKVFKTTSFDPHAYVTSKCQSMNEKEIRHLCSYLLDLKKASAEEMRKSVYANYSAFIRTSKEISNLEGQILSLKNLFSSRASLVHSVAEGIHIDSLSMGRNGEGDDGTTKENEEHSETEMWMSEFVDKVEVLLAEKRVDEALAAFEEGESVVEKAKHHKILSPASLSYLRNYLALQRQKLADHLAATAYLPSAHGAELRSAVMAMKHLGDVHRAHTLLLNSHYQILQYNTQNIRPGYSNGVGYITSLSQVVFTTISRAVDDSLSLFEEYPSFSSELVSWVVLQTNSYALLVKKNALDSFAATGGLRSASECVQICLGHCSALEARGLVLSPVFLKIFRPLVEQAMRANNKRIVKNVIALAATEDWMLTPPLGSHVGNTLTVGFSNASQPKLSRSAHRFNNMVQEMLEVVWPLESLQLIGITLECLLQTFSSYINVLISALPGSMESEGNPDGSGPKIVKIAQYESQQIALLANAFILADELIPQAVAKLFTIQKSVRADESSTKLSEIQFHVLEPREWKKKLTRMVDRLRDSFCRQHALDLIFTEDGDVRLTASMYLSMDENPKEPEWFPSLIFQELYEKLTRMSSVVMDIFVGRERFITVLMMRLTEAVILWLSEDPGFWEEVEDGPNPLGPLGLQQLYLDMEFVVLFSSHGHYLSRNLHNVTKNIISRAIDALSATGVNPTRFMLLPRLSLSSHQRTSHSTRNQYGVNIKSFSRLINFAAMFKFYLKFKRSSLSTASSLYLREAAGHPCSPHPSTQQRMEISGSVADGFMLLRVGFPSDTASFHLTHHHHHHHTYPKIHISMQHRITVGRRSSTPFQETASFIGEEVVYEQAEAFFLEPIVFSSHVSAYSSLIYIMDHLQVDAGLHHTIVNHVVGFVRMQVFHLLEMGMVVPVVVSINLMIPTPDSLQPHPPLVVEPPPFFSELWPDLESLEITVVNSEGETCAVCLEDMEIGTEATCLPCRHIFHGDCISLWLPSSYTCPLCRFPLPISPYSP